MKLPLRAAALVLSTAPALVPIEAPAQLPGNEPPFTITGEAVVLESDTIAIDGTVVSLWGVDGPWQIQPCLLNNVNWECGPVAKRELEILVDAGPVTCTQVRDTSLRRRFNNYGRCEVNSVDLAAEMVRRGMAMAFPEQSDEYVALEAEAKAAKAGLWKAEVFEPPWVWEDRTRQE